MRDYMHQTVITSTRKGTVTREGKPHNEKSKYKKKNYSVALENTKPIK
jgi:hypothetical protein